MRPEELIIPVKGKDGSVTLVGKSINTIALLGKTVSTSVDTSRNGSVGLFWSSSITFYAKNGQQGLIALRINSGSAKNLDVILPVCNTNGETDIDIHDPWYPSVEKMGQLVGTNIEVNIGGLVFATNDSSEKRIGVRYVPNEYDLLLQYLAGDVPAQAIIDAAQDAVRETDALAEAAELRKVKERLLLTIKNYDVEVAELRKEIGRAWESSAAVRKNKMIISNILHEIIDANKWKPWGKEKRQEVMRMLADDANDKAIG